jgi:ABC-2 type transport system permease protein
MNATSTLSSPAAAERGVTPNLLHAFGGIWRISYRRVFSRKHLVSLFWTVVVLAALTYVSTRTGNHDSFYGWTIRAYLTTVIPVLAFMSGAGAIREDMKPGGVDYLLIRPVPRPAFVVARFVSHVLCTQATCLAPFAALLGVGVFRQIDNLAAAWPTLLFAQVLAITAYTGLGFLFGSISARYLILAINYAAIIEIGLGQIPIALNKLSVLRHLKNLLEPIASDPGAAVFAFSGAWPVLGLLTLFTIVWLAVAAVAFSLQEFAGQRPKDA